MSDTPPATPAYQRFFAELKRREVFRVAAVYGAAGFVVLQVADLLAEGLALPDVVLRSATFLVLVGFPIAIILAWAYERTPEGVKRTDPARTGELEAIVAQPAGKRWPAGLLALAGVAALVWGAWAVGKRVGESAAEATAPAAIDAETVSDQTVSRRSNSDRDAAVLQVAYADLAEDTRPSVAVLPFTDLSPAGDQAYFADGMSEELLNALAKIRELRVAGRTSSFAYRNVEKDLREIGRELGVRYVVEGSVRKQDDRLRITAQLIDAEDNFHLWSETYDRTLDDVFVVQEEIAGAIAEELQVSLGLGEGAVLIEPTADLGAYELFLEGRARMRERGAGVQEAVQLFEAVVARDSNWAPGWAGLAQAYSLVPYYEEGARVEGVDASRWSQPFARSEQAAKRALALDPNVTAAHVALGSVYRDRWEWGPAEAQFLKALAIDPDDVEAHQQYAELLAVTGRLDEALRSIRRAVALDPTSAIRLNVLGWVLRANRRVRESIPQFELAALHGPDLAYPYLNLSIAYFQLGELDVAERLWREEYLPRTGLEVRERQRIEGAMVARFAALRAGDLEAYRACCRAFDEAPDWVLLGDTLAAIESLAAHFRDHPRYDGGELRLLWSPGLDPIRNDPRFQEAVEQILAYAGLDGARLQLAGEGE